MKLYRTAVVGLGQIGQGYDYACNDQGKILTHAAGFAAHPGFALEAGVDPEAGARAAFEKKYQRPAYASVTELAKRHEAEVFSLAVPTAHHASAFHGVMQHRPKAILCEKPIATTPVEAEEMLRVANEQGCQVLVNYMRRFDPGVLELKRRLERGDFGEIYKGTVWYSKGILNNGSHFIDLLAFLLGPVGEIEVLSRGRAPSEQWSGDPEPDLRVVFGGVEVYFLAGREECFSVRDLSLIGTRGSVQYLNGGLEIRAYGTGPNPHIPGYVVLSTMPELLENDLLRYQFHVCDALFAALSEGKPLFSNGATALSTLRTVEKILEIYRRKSK